MKVILNDKNYFVLRFDRDEEVLSGIATFMKSSNIRACAFTGIGACASVELGYFNEHLKDYRKKPYVDNFEVISFSGNGSIKDNEPSIHAHGLFGHNDFTVLGGHVFKMVVSITCEIFLTKLEGEMKRELNSDLNLNLLV